MSADECERPCDSIRCETYGCQGVGVPSPSVPVGGLPDGTRVKAVIEGKIFGQDIRVDSGVRAIPNGSRIVFERFPADWCVSVEPVPVVPEPGRWYRDREVECWWSYVGPDDATWLMRWDDNEDDLRIRRYASPADYDGPLVECEPPAEFRDGQQ